MKPNKKPLVTIKYAREVLPDTHFGALMLCTVDPETTPKEWPAESLAFRSVKALERFAAAYGCKAVEVPHEPVLNAPDVYKAGMVFVVRPHFADPLQLFYCSGGGFGCDPDKMGRAVFGHWISEEGQGRGEDRIDRHDVARLASLGEYKLAQRFLERDPIVRLKAQLDCYRQQSEDLFEDIRDGKASKERIADVLCTIHRNSATIERYLWDNWGAVAESEAKRRAACEILSKEENE